MGAVSMTVRSAGAAQAAHVATDIVVPAMSRRARRFNFIAAFPSIVALGQIGPLNSHARTADEIIERLYSG
jgi:hypothetical protein